MKQTKNEFLSVIIPVFNQGKTIKKNLLAILSELELFNTPFEVIIVSDGSVDNSYKEARKVSSLKVKVYQYEKNRGKGYAVRYGMARAKGDIIGFIDAGGEIRESGIPMLIEHMRWYNADIIVGSKRHPVSKVKYPLYRKILSFGYQQMVKFLFGLSIRDTQVGLKLYKRAVLENVLPRLQLNHFSFDIEILAVSNYLGYNRIFESPIELDFSRLSTTIDLSNTPFVVLNMLKDTYTVWYLLKVKHFYDDANKHLWQKDPNLLQTP